MIKNWKLFRESVDEKSKIVEICKKYKIENYTINDDLSIDVDDSVILSISYITFHRPIQVIPLKFRKVNNHFQCSYNNLTSLFGSPEYVGGSFSCQNNNLISLEYLPNWIGGDIYCEYNKICSFKGIPDNFTGYLYCTNNPIYQIWKLFESVKDIEFFNDCHIIREPETPNSLPIVIIERLNFFLETIGKPTVEKVDGYINI
jgi:hypothetical protein